MAKVKTWLKNIIRDSEKIGMLTEREGEVTSQTKENIVAEIKSLQAKVDRYVRKFSSINELEL